MSSRSRAPEKGPVALLLVDVINDLEFPGGQRLLRPALPMAKRLSALASRARAAKVPVVYANDNFGHWRSDFSAQVRHCLEDGVRGEPIARLLAPEPADYFVLKPKHSAFYSTALDELLRALGTTTIVLGGMAGDVCVLFTAHDAHMRELELIVPADGLASESAAGNRWALAHMERFVRADTRESARIDFRRLAGGRRAARPRRGVTRRTDRA